MEIIGRLTADAKVNVLPGDKEVVNFTIAVNDYYKPKGGEAKQLTTYINCSYWISSRIAARLARGTLVQLYGRIGVHAYNNMDGHAKASLTFHTDSIKILAASRTNSQQAPSNNNGYQPAGNTSITMDDVPF